MENMKRNYRILTINPGSTSTKIGVFDGEKCVVSKVVRHNREDLDCKGSVSVYWQKDLRKQFVLEALAENNIPLESLDATVGRAGRLPPMSSGTYTINEDLMNSIPDPLVSAGLLGMVIAKEIGDQLGIPSFIADPASVDEMYDIAKVTGFPGIERTSMFHALNQKAVARHIAQQLGKSYDECRLIVAHLGGGITVGAHLYGKVVDANHGSAGEGPFTPERAGTVPGLSLIKLCFSGKYSQEELEARFISNGGLYAFLGTSDMREIEKNIVNGDEQVSLLLDAMAYNICKAIGAMYAVMEADVDAIILTGGLTYSEFFCEKIINRIKKMGKVAVYPGEDELLALARGALRVLTGETKALIFSSSSGV